MRESGRKAARASFVAAEFRRQEFYLQFPVGPISPRGDTRLHTVLFSNSSHLLNSAASPPLVYPHGLIASAFRVCPKASPVGNGRLCANRKTR